MAGPYTQCGGGRARRDSRAGLEKRGRAIGRLRSAQHTGRGDSLFAFDHDMLLLHLRHTTLAPRLRLCRARRPVISLHRLPSAGGSDSFARTLPVQPSTTARSKTVGPYDALHPRATPGDDQPRSDALRRYVHTWEVSMGPWPRPFTSCQLRRRLDFDIDGASLDSRGRLSSLLRPLPLRPSRPAHA